MSVSDAFPAGSDVERHGNLLLLAWAPPSHEALAEAWVESALGALLGPDDHCYILGHRPGRVKTLPSGCLSGDTRSLLESLVPASDLGPLHALPHGTGRRSVTLLRAGDIHARWNAIHEQTGRTRVHSMHLGRVLVVSTVARILGVVQGTAPTPPLLMALSCLTNPGAGLRRTESAWLQSIRAWSGNPVAITLPGNALCMLAGREALTELRIGLLSWLSRLPDEAGGQDQRQAVPP